MSNTFCFLNVHIIFSTRGRRAMIRERYRDELFEYIFGVIKHKKGQGLAVGGVDDHIHVLASYRPTMAVANLVRDIKANSSRWLREKIPRFAWQESYGAFSVSKSQIATVRRYIENQVEHHSRQCPTSSQSRVKTLAAPVGRKSGNVVNRRAASRNLAKQSRTIVSSVRKQLGTIVLHW